MSVVVPAYNVERYIGQAIRSVLDQTEPSFEILVVNDGSTDRTREVVASVSDNRIRLIESPRNLGVSAARNLAIREAQGEWLAFLDADDWWDPVRLERLLEAAGHAGADMVADDCQLVEEGSGKAWATLFELRGLRLSRLRTIDATEFVRIDLGLTKPLIRRDLLARHGISFDESLPVVEDFVLYLESLLAGATFVVVPDAYYHYRARRDALTKDKVAVMRALAQVADRIGHEDRIRENDSLLDAVRGLGRRARAEVRYYEFVGLVKARRPLAAMSVAARSPSVLVTAATRVPQVVQARGSRLAAGGRTDAPFGDRAAARRLERDTIGPAARGRLRVLVVAPFLPYPPDVGFSIRTFHLIQELAKGNDVELLAFGRPEESWKVEALEALGVRARVVMPPSRVRAPDVAGPTSLVERSLLRAAQLARTLVLGSYQGSYLITKAFRDALAEMTGDGSVDIIQIETSELGRLVPTARRCGARVVLDEHNIEYDLRLRIARTQRSRLRAANNWLEAHKFAREERRCWSRVDGCLAVSDRDNAIVKAARAGLPTAVIPNGVDLDTFVPRASSTGDGPRLTFVGRLDYRPNADGILWFARTVLPLVRRFHPVRLSIVGPNPPPEIRALAGETVEVTGRVQDVRPFLADATVVVVPLRSGGGTRIKVLEALAMARPVVSTSVGAEGLDVVDHEHLVLADDPESMASAIIGLVENRERADALGQRGRALVERDYTWTSIGSRLDAFYRALAAHDADGTIASSTLDP